MPKKQPTYITDSGCVVMKMKVNSIIEDYFMDISKTVKSNSCSPYSTPGFHGAHFWKN